jgi:hypothetical protein
MHVKQAVHEGIVRGLIIVGLAGVALIHLMDAPGQFSQASYIGWMYVGLITSCVVLAAAHLRGSDPRLWTLTILLALSVMTGYVVSRTVGLPGLGDDIGNWSEPLGIASLFVEGSLIAVSSHALHAFAPNMSSSPIPA